MFHRTLSTLYPHKGLCTQSLTTTTKMMLRSSRTLNCRSGSWTFLNMDSFPKPTQVGKKGKLSLNDDKWAHLCRVTWKKSINEGFFYHLGIFQWNCLFHRFSGIPKTFTTVAELVKFVTMVIFTSSAQHASVNSGQVNPFTLQLWSIIMLLFLWSGLLCFSGGMRQMRGNLYVHLSLQYDYGGWMPNTPISLQRPPPTTKGTTSEATMLQTFPDVNTTAQGMATMWLLSKQSSDFVSTKGFEKWHQSHNVQLCKILKVHIKEPNYHRWVL